ncbi:MAG: isoprenylcysteine carboxyl methyltransferase family protein [Gemmatimonadota bacterium]
MKLYFGFLLLLVSERLVELSISRRNAAWALGQGGIEVGQRHFRAMQLLHTAFFLACAAEVAFLRRPFRLALGFPMLALALASQVLRYWAIAALGRRWNVRVIVIPGVPAVDRGPYRYVRHPNYVAVILEGFAVPLIHSAWITAVCFTVLNAALLAVRIRCEEEALRAHADYARRLGGRPRFLPLRTRPGER